MMNRILHLLIASIVSLTSLSACRDYDIESNNSLESHDNAVGAYMNLAFSITSNTSSKSRDTRDGGGGAGGGDKEGVAKQSFYTGRNGKEMTPLRKYMLTFSKHQAVTSPTKPPESLQEISSLQAAPPFRSKNHSK